MASASVIVPAYNAAGTIGRTLDALARQDTEAHFEVIVVDDGSTDQTERVVRDAPIEVQFLKQRKRGPGEARNAGAQAASGEVLAFTDADCIPAPGWLAAGLEAIDDGADLVQGAVWPDPSTPRLPFDRTVWVAREGGLYECASLFVRRDLFSELGGFEDLLGAGIGKQLAEDTWLGWRARRRGATTAFSAEARVDHAVFRRGPGEYVGERVRLLYFPSLVRHVPELRREFLWRRYFLSPRTAAFDLAAAGAVIAVAAGSPLALVAAGPYLWIWGRRSLEWRLRAPLAAVSDLAADAVGFAALLAGSIRDRALVI